MTPHVTSEPRAERRLQALEQRFPGIEPQPQRPVAGWPTYMHDNSRSGLTSEPLPLPLTLAWVLHPGVNPAWPPPAKQDFSIVCDFLLDSRPRLADPSKTIIVISIQI